MYVLNYTTLVQISENGYPFFIIMLRVAWWMRRSWLIISKSLEGSSRVSSEPSSVCANGWNASPQNTPKPILPRHRTPKRTQRSDLTSCGRYNPDSWRNAMNIANSIELLSGFQLNKKKTKALWIGTSSKNKIDPLKFQCPKDPIKIPWNLPFP